MIVSDAKREANRRNALKSTGPKTVEGKAVSRQNAVKHGLCSSVVVAEDAETIEERYKELFFDLKPRTQLQNYCVSHMVILSLRIDRAERIERRLRDQVALRAMTSWDEDRGLEAERVGRGLANRPAEVVAELRRTPQGCDWLIGRWAMLAYAADSDAKWDEGRRALAFDLLGTPPQFRFGNPGATIDEDGRLIDDGSRPADVARAQIARLREAREVAAGHDEVQRALTEADLVHEPDAETRRLRRYESTLHHRLRWFLARFRDPIDKHQIPPHIMPDQECIEGVGLRVTPKGSFYVEARAKAPVPPRTVVEDHPRPAEPNEAKAEGQNEAKSVERDRSKAGSSVLTGVIATLDGAKHGRKEVQDRNSRAGREAKRRKLDRKRA